MSAIPTNNSTTPINPLPLASQEADSSVGLLTLPTEILMQVCTHLNGQAVASLSLVNRELAQIAGSSDMWKFLFKRDLQKYVASFPRDAIFNCATYHRHQKLEEIIENIKQGQYVTSLIDDCQITQFKEGQLQVVKKDHPQEIQLQELDPSTGKFVVKGTINWLKHPQVLFKDSPNFQEIEFSLDETNQLTLVHVTEESRVIKETFFSDESIEKVFVHNNILCICVRSASNQRKHRASKDNFSFVLLFQQTESGITKVLEREVAPGFQLFSWNNYIVTPGNMYTLIYWNFDNINTPQFELVVAWRDPIHCFHMEKNRSFIASGIKGSKVKIWENDIRSQSFPTFAFQGRVSAIATQGPLLFIAVADQIMVFEKDPTKLNYNAALTMNTKLSLGVEKMAYDNGVLIAEEYESRCLQVMDFRPSSP